MYQKLAGSIVVLAGVALVIAIALFGIPGQTVALYATQGKTAEIVERFAEGDIISGLVQVLLSILALAHGSTHEKLALLFALVLIIAGVIVLNYRPRTSSPVVGKRFRIVDLIYFIVAAPLILAVVHEYGLCLIAPDLGLHAGDDSGCTIGWGFLILFPIIPLWVLLTPTIALHRVITLYRLSRFRSPVFWLYVASVALPALLILPLFI